MTHQTLISSAPAFSSAPHASPSSSPTRSSSSSAAASVMSSSSSFAHHHHGPLVESEGSMSALRSSLRPYEAEEEVVAAVVAGPAAWGDGFLVEDLLDLEELCEVEKEGGLLCEAAPAAEGEEKCSDSHGSSAVSYELMPLLPPEMDLPAHDAEELEWVSRVMDDSLAELPPPPLRLPAAPSAEAWRPQGAAYPMRTPTICALSTEALVPVRSKKRSKRSRATTVWSLSGASMSYSASSSATTSSSSSSASLSSFFLLDSPTFATSGLLDEPPRSRKSKHGSHKAKKRGRKPKHHFPPQLSASPPVPGDRCCSHCGVQKTPQWRAGPEGAKTLCNACGVRFKSGRLLPEYRPACSPTFVGDLHSNSHRKVLEMRRKKDPVIEVAVAAPTVASF